MDIYLEKVDPDTNCYRFFSIRIEPDLFAPAALVTHWGRIGTRGRTRIRGSGPVAKCESMGEALRSLRLRHGYFETSLS